MWVGIWLASSGPVVNNGGMTSDSAADAAGQEPVDQGASEQESPQEATKRRFREALKAKQGRHGEDHLNTDPHPSEHGHGPVNEKRTFRRKTG